MRLLPPSRLHCYASRFAKWCSQSPLLSRLEGRRRVRYPLCRISPPPVLFHFSIWNCTTGNLERYRSTWRGPSTHNRNSIPNTVHYPPPLWLFCHGVRNRLRSLSTAMRLLASRTPTGSTHLGVSCDPMSPCRTTRRCPKSTCGSRRSSRRRSSRRTSRSMKSKSRRGEWEEGRGGVVSIPPESLSVT